MQPHNQTTLAGKVISEIRSITNGKGETIKKTFTLELASEGTGRPEQFYVECCASDLLDLLQYTQKGDGVMVGGKLINRAGGDAGIRASVVFILSIETSNL